MLEVADLVNELRGVHAAFTRAAVDSTVARQFIVRAANFILNQVSGLDPDIVAVEGEVPAREEGGTGYLDALDDASNPQSGVKVPPFASLVDNFEVANEEGVAIHVFLVSFNTQYPHPYAEAPLTFPAVARRGGYLHFTDARKVGNSTHGWEDFQGPVRYMYVPYYAPVAANFGALDIPEQLRSAIVLRAAERLALRLELHRYYAATQGRFGNEIDLIVSQLSHVDDAAGSHVVAAG